MQHNFLKIRIDLFIFVFHTRCKEVFLSVMPKHSDNFSTYASLDLPSPMTDLYDPQNAVLNFEELLQKCEETFMALSISADEVQ